MVRVVFQYKDEMSEDEWREQECLVSSVAEANHICRGGEIAMKYEHINDCWNAIRNAKTEEEVQELFEEFPRWSGSWDLMIQDNGSYIVYNTYEEYGCEQTDKETIYLEDYEEE